jgi:hypothetical protein
MKSEGNFIVAGDRCLDVRFSQIERNSFRGTIENWAVIGRLAKPTGSTSSPEHEN